MLKTMKQELCLRHGSRSYDKDIVKEVASVYKTSVMGLRFVFHFYFNYSMLFFFFCF